MGLRSPQEINRVAIRPDASTRFQGAVAPKIDGAFLNNAAQGLQVGEQKRIKAEKDAFDLAQTDFDNAGDAARLEAQVKLSNTEGIPAGDEAKKQKDWINRTLEKKLNAAPEKYRQLLSQRRDKALIQFDTYATPYANQQAKKVQDDIYKTRIANDINVAVEGSGDINFLAGDGLNQVAESIRKTSMRRYGDNPDREISPGVYARDLIDNDIRQGVSETLRRSIQMQAGLGRTDLATKTLAGFSGHMRPTDILKANKAIEVKQKDMTTDSALSLSDTILKEADGNMALAEAIAKDRVGADGRLYNQTIAMMRTTSDIQAKQKEKDIEATKGSLFEKVDKGQDYSAELKTLPFEEREKALKALERNRGVSPKLTNFNAYDNTRDVLMSDDYSIQDKERKLKAVRSDVTTDKYKSLQNIFDVQKKSDTEDRARTHLTAYRSANDITTRFFNENKINPKSSTAKRIKADLDKIIDEILPSNPNLKEFRQKYANELRKRRVSELPVEGTGIFGFFQDKQKELTEVVAEDSNASDQTHPQVLSAIRERLMRKKPNATERDLNQYIDSMRKRGFNLSDPNILNQ